MKRLVSGMMALLALLTGCSSGGSDGSYQSVSQEKAAELMETEENYIILDVRTQNEYDEGHLPNAVLVPHNTIKGDVPELPDKDQLILVYCRSGNRSKVAAQALADQGYTNVVEFGGINTWKGEITTD